MLFLFNPPRILPFPLAYHEPIHKVGHAQGRVVSQFEKEKKMNVLTGSSPIVKKIIEALGLPECTKSIELRIAPAENIIVKAEFYIDPDWSKPDGLVAILKEFELHERSSS